ncbi:MAG: thioredoxin-dependent thiol peroxidase [Patescibacteria group bacterium]
MIEVGKKAPAFTAVDQQGKTHNLADYAGKWVLLYFYPKDDTPGCTKEACALQENWDGFKKLNAVVLGVSKDGQESHLKFANKYNLKFPLLVDEDLKLANAYGVWGEKKMMGRTYMGVKRESFLINPDGKIAKHYKTVKPPIHADQVLADLASMK